MKYTLTINQNRSVEWKLTASESIVFSWIYELPSWADKMEYNGTTYYFGSRNVACKELPIITDKIDTMYRLYKSLEKKGLIYIVVLQKKDYIAITEKGKKWHYDNELPNDGKKSEETRKEIRENSERNPTNKYTKDEYTSDNKKENTDLSVLKKSFNFKQYLLDLGVDEDVVDDWLSVRKKKKATNSERAFNTIRKEIEKSGKSANECITIAADRCWAGFEAEWVKNIKSRYSNHQKDVPLYERHEAIKPDMPILNEDGDLMDGTFYKQNARWYVSDMDSKAHSIPIKAPMRPDNRYEWDSVNNRWYLPSDKWEASDELW